MKRRERRHRLGIKTHLAQQAAQQAPRRKKTSSSPKKNTTINRNPFDVMRMVLFAMTNLHAAVELTDEKEKNRKFQFVRVYFRSLPSDLLKPLTQACVIIQSLDDRAANGTLSCGVFMQEQRSIRKLFCLPETYFDKHTKDEVLDTLNERLCLLFAALQNRYSDLVDAAIVTKPVLCAVDMGDVKSITTTRPTTAAVRRPLTANHRSLNDVAAQRLTHVVNELCNVLTPQSHGGGRERELDELMTAYDTILLQESYGDNARVMEITALWTCVRFLHLHAEFPTIVVAYASPTSLDCRPTETIKQQQHLSPSKHASRTEAVSQASRDFQKHLHSIQRLLACVERRSIRESLETAIQSLTALIMFRLNKTNARRELDLAVLNGDVLQLEAVIEAAKRSGVDTQRAEAFLRVKQDQHNVATTEIDVKMTPDKEVASSMDGNDLRDDDFDEDGDTEVTMEEFEVMHASPPSQDDLYAVDDDHDDEQNLLSSLEAYKQKDAQDTLNRSMTQSFHHSGSLAQSFHDSLNLSQAQQASEIMVEDLETIQVEEPPTASLKSEHKTFLRVKTSLKNVSGPKHLLLFAHSDSFSTVKEQIAKTYTSSPYTFSLSWRDEDGDDIQLVTDADWRAAIVAGAVNNKLNVYLTFFTQ